MTMLSEIREQPAVIERVLHANPGAARRVHAMMEQTTHGLIAARGTSDNAGRYAQYVWGARNRYSVGLTTPSLFSVYDDPPALDGAMVVGLSQSGESPDVVSVLAEARRQERPAVAITNSPDSPLAAAADVVLELAAGEEKAVAATKTYTSELANVALISAAGQPELISGVVDAVAAVLELDDQIEEAAQRFARFESCAVIARGYNHATAYEVALKIQELTHTVAQPYSTADFLHGPVAVLEPGYPVVALAFSGPTMAEITEVLRRCLDARCRLLLITDDPGLAGIAPGSILLPPGLDEWLTPLPAAVAGQLLAYHLTIAAGLDPDSPRGLTKVTRTV